MDEKREIPPHSDLAEWVDQVEHGGSIELTREGRTVARIVPIEQAQSPKPTPPTWEELKALRAGIELPEGTTIKDLINEGRRL